MEHLTVDEIIEFVSATDLKKETVSLIARVNQHIVACPKCFKLVKAFQTVRDELVEVGQSIEIKKCLYELVENEFFGEGKNYVQKEEEPERSL